MSSLTLSPEVETLVASYPDQRSDVVSDVNQCVARVEL